MHNFKTRLKNGFTQHHFFEFRKLKQRIHFSISGAGFTLIELLIVITVIGILAGGVIVIVNPVVQIQKAQDAKRKTSLAQIQKALEVYYQDNRTYPPNPSVTDYRIKDLDGNPVDWGNEWMPYMGNLPKDPSSSKNYVYYSNGQTYYLYASLDRGANDPQACHSDGTSCDNVPGSASCGESAICNYGVSSSNVSP